MDTPTLESVNTLIRPAPDPDGEESVITVVLPLSSSTVIVIGIDEYLEYSCSVIVQVRLAVEPTETLVLVRVSDGGGTIEGRQTVMRTLVIY